MWSGLAKPYVIGHRGASAHAPENTLAAFEAAFREGAEGIEFDVRLTQDGQVIVLHDQTVDRTTNGKGNVARMQLAELRELDAGSSFSVEFRGERIPTLDELFEAVGKRLYMNIELKNYATPFDALVPKVVELVQKHHLEERVLFSSFLAYSLQKARRLQPLVPCGLLTIPGWAGAWGRTIGWRGGYAALHPPLPDMSEQLVLSVHAAGKRLHVWTVNAEADLRRMIAWGVDGIITDDPALACRLLGRTN